MSFIVDKSGFKAWKGGSNTRKGPDTVFIHKSTNGWNLIVSVDEERRLIMKATRNIGKIGKGMNDGQDASITLLLQTINGRIPDFALTNPYYNQATASSTEKAYVEINNKIGIITKSFKPELEFYERHWPGSSILEIREWLCSLVPDFESLLEDQKLDEYISSIIEQAADVQPSQKKQYQKANISH